MSRTGSNPWIQSLAAVMLAAGLGACSVKTSVSVSAATPAQVQHLYVTIAAVWLHADASAPPDGAGWVGQALATPKTLDLAALTAGSLSELVSGIDTPPATYRQLRLELADSSAALTSAARSAGLSWNAQVQYLDTAGDNQTLPLELPSPAAQLIVPVSLTLQGAGVLPILSGSMLAANLNSGSSGSNKPALGFAALTGASASASTADGIATGGDTAAGATVVVSSSTTASTASIAVDIQAIGHWVPFDFGGQAGALLSPSIIVYDTAKAGGITGTLDVSGIDANVLAGTQGIVVTAETLSADGTRFEPVKSVGVSGSGAFTLYPLPIPAGADNTRYDLVIHGPSIRSVIISQVPVSAGAASASTVIQSTALKPAPARHFPVNTAANSGTLPGGSWVGFYQTVPGFTAPHLIESAMPDPFTGGFSANVSLSADVIDYGRYANGGDIQLSSSAPDEGVGTYRIGADAPLRVASVLSNTISAPTLGTSGVQPLFLPAPGAALGGAELRVSGTMTFARPGRFDRGFVMISRGGMLIDAADLSASLSGLGAQASFSLGALPAGLPGGRYEVSVRLWNSRDPRGTLTRVAAASTLNAAAGGAQSVGITVP
jgi:hypothetical protein